MNIKAIIIHSGAATHSYVVGYDGVTAIIDNSLETATGIYVSYRIKRGNDTIADVINCPIEVRYE